MTCYTEVRCTTCGSQNVKCIGCSTHNVPRYRCCNIGRDVKTFMLEYCYKACEPGIKKQIIEMAINGSGIRDTGRVLGISKTTVISTLKKREKFSSR